MATSFPPSSFLPPSADTLHLTSLHLPVPFLAPNCWSHPRKPQPGTLSLRLALRAPGFASSAATDALDTNTLHYGVLAKKIRAAAAQLCTETGTEGVSPLQALQLAMDWIARLGGQAVKAARAEVALGKAGMCADEVRVWVERMVGLDDERGGVVFEGVRMAVLLGVNAYERAARQPVVGEVEVGWEEGDYGEEDLVERLFEVESVFVEIVQATAFETLEALIQFTVTELQRRILSDVLPGGWVRVRLAKPRAVVFADAPAVEVVRRVRTRREVEKDEGPVLNVVKPYI